MSDKSDITFVTYDQLPDLDRDDRSVLEQLRARGFKCGAAVWNDRRVAWHDAGLCVIRSTWDYHLQYGEFLDWIERVSQVTQLANSAEILRWNSNKRYLAELSAEGVPVVPTLWLEREGLNQPVPGPQCAQIDCMVSIAEILKKHEFEQAVIKPSIGLSTFGVLFVSSKKQDSRSGGGQAEWAGDRATESKFLRLLESSHPSACLMIQPYLDSVRSYGERALVFINGRYSHAVRKTAFQPLAEAGQAGELLVEATEPELALAHRVLAALAARNSGKEPLYARVDIVRDDRGEERLIELELVEPSLYLSLHPPAVAAFADALARCLSPAER